MIWASVMTMPLGLTEPLFVPAYWNPPSLFNLAQRTGFDIESLIFAFAIGALLAGAVGTLLCRPDLWRSTLVGGLLFLALYIVFLLGLKGLWPGYIEGVWNLPALLPWRPAGLPTEELGFGFAFGMYWSSVYEHFAWRQHDTPRRAV